MRGRGAFQVKEKPKRRPQGNGGSLFGVQCSHSFLELRGGVRGKDWEIRGY